MESTAGPSVRVCRHCNGQLVEDDSGSISMLLCESCGAVATDEQLVLGGDNASDIEDLPDITRQSLGDLSQKVKGRKGKTTKREKTFLAIVSQMASDTHLTGRELQMCKEEGLQLLRTKIKFQKLKYIAAGLVFLSLKRQTPTVTFREVSQLTHIEQKPLGRVVKWLKKQSCAISLEQSSSEYGCTFVQSIQHMLDRLSLPPEKAKDTRQVTKDLKMILNGSLERLLSHSRGLDGAILLLALDYVFKDTPNAESSWSKQVADLAQIKMITLKTRVSETKRDLLSVAVNVPSLESKIKDRVINARNIHKYISYLLENKGYLVSLHQTSRTSPQSSDDEEEGVAIQSCDPSEAHLPSLYHPCTKLRHRRLERSRAAAQGEDVEEDERWESYSDLDDAELSRYIASDKEVKEKKRYFKKQQI